jgi:DNA-binding MarR family transcriptional regulator
VALEKVVGFRLRRLSSLFGSHWQRWFRVRKLAVTPVQGGILLLIREEPGVSQAAIARRLRIEAPTLLETLTPLLDAGLVARKRSVRDSRAFSLTLTAAGRRAADLVGTETPAHEADLLADLTPSERRELLRLLDKAVASAERNSA